MKFYIWNILIGITCLLPTIIRADEPKAPTTVKELFADFDPRKDPLDAKVVRGWEKDGIVYRYVTYHIGTFKGKPARMAAFFAFPKGAKKLPGLLHIHGGGQRAFLHEVEFYAKRGYACLSINWGGREMEDAKEGEPNTDWGAIHPTQNNVPGYGNARIRILRYRLPHEFLQDRVLLVGDPIHGAFLPAFGLVGMSTNLIVASRSDNSGRPFGRVYP